MKQRSCHRGWRVGLMMVVGVVVAFPALVRAWDEETFFQKRLTTHSFVLPRSVDDFKTQTVVGLPTEYVIQKKDTLLDIARHFDLGYNELADAYLGMDPWLPPVGKNLIIPTFWILPKSEYKGVVVNIPEMRLYYFPPMEKGINNRVVITVPTGMGREDWPTPQAKFTIRGKTVNPTWIIPESIKKERIKEKGWTEDRIPGGSPDNPMGKYRIELTLPVYAIHDTNNPWAVGRLVTHGCVRLYPEDIEQFFDIIRVGTPGEFTYQTVKIGMLYGKVYAEVHEDIYKIVPDLWNEAQKVVRESGWAEKIDQTLLRRAVQEKSGVPMDITIGSRPPLAVEVAAVQTEDLSSELENSRADRYDPEVATAEVNRVLVEPESSRMDDLDSQPVSGTEKTETETDDAQPLEPKSLGAEERGNRPRTNSQETREIAKLNNPPPVREDLRADELEGPSHASTEIAVPKLNTPRPEQRVSKGRSIWRRLLFLGDGEEEEAELESQPAGSTEVAVTKIDIPRPEPVRLDVQEQKGRNAHLRRAPLEPRKAHGPLKSRAYLETLSDWDLEARYGTQGPYRKEVPSP